MTAYQQGEVSAFAELVARHEKPLWNFLRRSVKDAAAAEDLLQETFMRVVKGASEWRPSAKFSTWLYTIARNLCVDHARRMSHRAVVSLDRSARTSSDSEPPRLYDKLADSEQGGEQRTLNRELAGELERALASLPELQREVFLLREVMELPFAEIAQAVGASEATVKSRMRYALERLRSELEAMHERTRGEAVLP
jgi:RNA polymerase sigma-70 factor (ECF subfamily)